MEDCPLDFEYILKSFVNGETTDTCLASKACTEVPNWLVSILRCYFCYLCKFCDVMVDLSVVHARIRNNCSNLNNDLFIDHLCDNPLCNWCIEIEDGEHYFFNCNIKIIQKRTSSLFRNSNRLSTT